MKNYDSQISSQTATMNSCIQSNARYKEDIENLKAAQIKLESLLNSVESVSGKSNRKILNIPNILGIVMKFTLLAPISDALTGSPYKSSVNAIKDGIRDVKNKIKELNNKIEQNNRTISSCKSKISSLKSQKAADLKKESEKKS